MSTLEIKVQALEADKGTCTSEAPAEPEKRKRRTPLCLQVCQANLAVIHLLNACVTRPSLIVAEFSTTTSTLIQTVNIQKIRQYIVSHE